jgi:hypothetical protein
MILKYAGRAKRRLATPDTCGGRPSARGLAANLHSRGYGFTCVAGFNEAV